MDSMEPVVCCAQFVKQMKCHWVNTMVLSGTFFIFFARKLLAFSSAFIRGKFSKCFHFQRPSSSRAEKLPNVYYEAEHDGETRGCQSYEEFCSNGIFNLISKIIEH